MISTHTLRKEGDHLADSTRQGGSGFQPTPSARRVTATKCLRNTRPAAFQPTPSARRVTAFSHLVLSFLSISTHTLRKEGDCFSSSMSLSRESFQPTPSARRVTLTGSRPGKLDEIFQPTPSARRVTLLQKNIQKFWLNFNPHPPQGG